MFDSRDKQENICSQLSKLGLVKHSSSFISSLSEMLQLNCKITARHDNIQELEKKGDTELFLAHDR